MTGGQLLIAAALGFFLLRQHSGQEPIEWWIDEAHTLVRAPGLEPPAPGFRPASDWERSQYGLATPTGGTAPGVWSVG